MALLMKYFQSAKWHFQTLFHTLLGLEHGEAQLLKFDAVETTFEILTLVFEI